MSSQAIVLNVFVASPSDITEERTVLDNIVIELNKLLGKGLGLRLEIMKLETDTYPSIGEDPQSVISQQIGDDYDIFIGLLWKRFGKPTKKSSSGTEEEFYEAYTRAKERPSSVRVMIYFSDKPFTMSEIDLEQAAKVKDFETKIDQLGVYFGHYNAVDDFARLIRIQLGMVMKDFGVKWGKEDDEKSKQGTQAIAETVELIGENDNEEEGFLDLVISSLEEINSSTEALGRILEIMNDNNSRTKCRTEELNQLPKPLNPIQARSVINHFAEDLDNFYERMNVEIPILSKSFRSGIDKWTRSGQLMVDFQGENKPIVENAIEAIVNFKNVIGDAKKSTQTFRNIVQGLGRTTTQFNHSKRKVVEMLDTLINEYHTEETLSEGAEAVFRDVLTKV